ncbi:MAG: tyrosine-type recombinase/integrase [Candidatus Dormibacteria bacterium]
MDTRRQPQVTGPLAFYADGFGGALAEKGYAPGSARNQRLVVAHLSRWLGEHGLDAADLTEDAVQRFLVDWRQAGYRSRLSPASVSQILSYLRGIGVTPPAVAVEPGTPLDVLMQRYACYLTCERGLAAQSVAQYVRAARSFFVQCRGDGDIDLAGLSPAEVTRFVLSVCQGASVAQVQRSTSRVRSLLRFLYLEALTDLPLAPAVPRAASRVPSLPKAIDASDVARLLGSCDRQSAVGCRDFAVLSVLARLGIRASELASLRLCDLDWRNGEMAIHGKGGRIAKLPIPVDIGEAIVAWLRQGRPAGAGPFVFTTLRAPLGGLSNAGISQIVARACQRAGLAPMHAHRLRHTAATGILREGGSLVEVAQILRHQSQATSSLYAKVDRAALSVLAQPWPGAGR